jgi:hypothetical protein
MTLTAPVTEKYNLGPVKPWVSNAAYLIGPQFGISTIYGWRQSDPFPDHPSGHALDFMTPNMTAGENLKNYAVANHVNLGIKYIIWNRTYYSDTNSWAGSPYTATTNPHTDHVHITFLDSAGPWTSTAGFNPATAATTASATTTVAATDDTCAWGLSYPKIDVPLVHIGGDTCIITKRKARFAMGAVLMFSGSGLIVVGAILLIVYGLGKTKVGTAALPSVVRKFI